MGQRQKVDLVEIYEDCVPIQMCGGLLLEGMKKRRSLREITEYYVRAIGLNEWGAVEVAITLIF